MNIYIKKFEIRWADIDANRHLANSAYMQYASHTRLSFLADQGFGQEEFNKYNVGPAALVEQFYYFREVSLKDTIFVRLEIVGLSEDGSFFQFRQRMYNQYGKNIALCTVKGAWIDLQTRKISPPPSALTNCLINYPKSKDFKYINKEDLRSPDVIPEHIDPELLSAVIDQ